MSKADKLITKLRSKPKDFRWSEVETIMSSLGFEKIEGNGSRVKFVMPGTKLVINLHKPHPSNEMKSYAVKLLLEKLIEQGLV